MPDCSEWEDLMNIASLGMAETSLMIANATAANQAFASAYMDALIELELCEASRAAQGSGDAKAIARLKQKVQEIGVARESLKETLKLLHAIVPPKQVE